MKHTPSNTLKAASQQWNKEAIKRNDIQKRKARKDARGRQWQAVS